jgi:hypothetical protein
MIYCTVAHTVFSSLILSMCFSRVMVLWIGPYSCLLFKMCDVYADWGSLFFMYLICSWYLCFEQRLVCRTYDM